MTQGKATSAQKARHGAKAPSKMATVTPKPKPEPKTTARGEAVFPPLPTPSPLPGPFLSVLSNDGWQATQNVRTYVRNPSVGIYLALSFYI